MFHWGCKFEEFHKNWATTNSNDSTVFNIIHINIIIHTFSVPLLPLSCVPAEISVEQVCSFGPGISVSCLGIWHTSWYLQKYISRIIIRIMTKLGYSRTRVNQIIWEGFNTNLIFFPMEGGLKALKLFSSRGFENKWHSTSIRFEKVLYNVLHRYDVLTLKGNYTMYCTDMMN